MTLTIPAESRTATATFNVDPAQDTLDEGTGETVVIAGAHSGGLTVSSATFTIDDDDTLVKTVNLSFDPDSINENSAGDNNGDVAVDIEATLSGNATSTSDITVNLADSLGGTATSSHYASSGLPASVTISAGQSSGSVAGLKINPTDNNTSGGDKTITLAQHGTNALSGFTVNDATLTLVDDEKPVITLRLSTTTAGRVGGQQHVGYRHGLPRSRRSTPTR